MYDVCIMCGKLTNGTYLSFPVCFEHYEDGTLAEYMKENSIDDTIDTQEQTET